MSAAHRAADALALLGPVEGPIAVAGSERDVLAAAVGARVSRSTDDPAAGALVSFVGTAAVPAERQACLAALRARLAPDAPLVLVDHNQPRRWPGRVAAALALLGRGLAPARGRYPAARELQALGYRVDRLCLADGERVQMIVARRASAA